MKNEFDCFCDCDDGDIEQFSETWRIAGKKLTCSECGSDIKKGEKYIKISAVWNGRYKFYRQCEICQKVFMQLTYQGYCISYGYLWEYQGM